MADKETTKGGRSASSRKTSPDPKAPKTPAAPKPAMRTSGSDPTKRSAPDTAAPQTRRAAPPKPASNSANSLARKASSPPKPRARSTSKPPARQRPTMPRPDISRWESAARRALRRTLLIIKALTDPALWRRLAQKLPSWTDELGALLLIVMGVVMLTALVNTTSEAVLSLRIASISRQIFGGSAYLVALALLAGGIILLLPKFGITFEPGWARTAALEVAFVAFAAVLHLIANDPEPRALAREGGGGGYLGWAVSQFTVTLLGNRLSLLLFSLVLVGSIILVAGLRRAHFAVMLSTLRSQIQGRLTRIETEVEEYEHYIAPAPPEAMAATQPPRTSITHPPVTARGLDTTLQPARVPAAGPKPSPARDKPDLPREALPTPEGDATRQAEPNTAPEAAPAKPLTREELKKRVEETRRNLGATNGRSLVSPGEPGERESVVPRDFLPDARMVSAAPRARTRRNQLPSSERYFTVDDFREVKKITKREDNLPPFDLLSNLELNKPTEEEINLNARIIKNTLMEFDVETEVIDVKVGPTVTQYAVSPYTESVNDEGETVLNRVRVSQISNLNGDLALALSAKRLRIQAPVPGHAYVGVEVPNRQPSVVALRPVLESETFHKYRKRPLALPLGRDVSGDSFVTICRRCLTCSSPVPQGPASRSCWPR